MKTKQNEGLVFLSPAGKVMKNRWEQIWGFEREVYEIDPLPKTSWRGGLMTSRAAASRSESVLHLHNIETPRHGSHAPDKCCSAEKRHKGAH